MAILRASEIRKMSKEERRKRLLELRSELIRLRAMAKRGTLDNPGRIKEIKRTIARILTIENEEKRKER